MTLLSYINEIYDIADKYRESPQQAMSKFLTNVTKGENYYSGADSFDYAAIKENFAELSATSFDFIRFIKVHSADVYELRAEGKRDEVIALANNTDI